MSRTAHALVAEKIKAFRLQARKSQYDVAIHLGIGQQAYSSYETGRVGIPIRYLPKICDLLHADVNEILVLYGEVRPPLT